MKNRYFKELTLNLQREGFTVRAEEAGLLPIELDGQHLCQVTGTGEVRYWKEDVAGGIRSEALDRIIDTAKTIAEYMRQLETAPLLTASGLTGDYRLLSEFNDIVLAGHPSKYGVQFVTWEWVQSRTALYQGNYYGPGVGVDSYAAAKRDFAARSGLVPRGALFTPEQLTEIYRSIYETLDSGCPITEQRQKCLETAAEQIKTAVPDLDERVALSNNKELEFTGEKFAQNSGMQFR